MNNTINLTEDTIIKLQELIIEIDENESADDCDSDIVIENLYKIKDLVSKIVL